MHSSRTVETRSGMRDGAVRQGNNARLASQSSQSKSVTSGRTALRLCRHGSSRDVALGVWDRLVTARGRVQSLKGPLSVLLQRRARAYIPKQEKLLEASRSFQKLRKHHLACQQHHKNQKIMLIPMVWASRPVSTCAQSSSHHTKAASRGTGGTRSHSKIT